MASNTYTLINPLNKQFDDWIELFNDDNNSLNISGYYLSDDENNSKKWRIPEGTSIQAEGFLLFWADSLNQQNHTNFKISASKGILLLSDKNGTTIDSIRYKKQKSNISTTKKDKNIYFCEPTPKQTNTTTFSLSTKSKKPTFSLLGGIYPLTQTLNLTTLNNATIYYTLDGSIPTKESNVYTGSIMISQSTPVRARALEKNKLLSGVRSHTYLIGEKISLPVMSLSIDDDYLYDDTIGIYKNFTTDWMRAGNIELFKDGVSQFSKNVAVRISGDGSRKLAQKSIAIFMKDAYGSKTLKYPLFAYKPQIQEVKSFILRNSGNDWGMTMLRDGLTQTIAKDIDNIDFFSYEPAVLFINGAYHGICNIREKPNENYIQANHGVNSKDVILLDNTIDAEYKKIRDFARQNPMNITQNYAYIESQVDIDELIKYEIMEIFVGNNDWPRKNTRYWKENKAGSKWRFFLYDTDLSYARISADTAQLNNFKVASLSSTGNTIYRNLLNNPEFVNRFTSTFSTYLNTILLSQNTVHILDTLSQKIAPEIPRHFQYWHQRSWNKSVDKVRNYLLQRVSSIKSHMQAEFALGLGEHTLAITKAQNGKILIDGITLNQDYNGTYFHNAILKLQAIPDAGYQLGSWSNGAQSSEIQITMDTNQTINAQFF